MKGDNDNAPINVHTCAVCCTNRSSFNLEQRPSHKLLNSVSDLNLAVCIYINVCGAFTCQMPENIRQIRTPFDNDN